MKHLVANRDNYSGSWETFYIVNNDDGTVSPSQASGVGLDINRDVLKDFRVQ